MPTESISMRKLKEILRLKYQANLSNRKISKSLSISASTISTYLTRAKSIGISSWPLSDEWSDAVLSKQFLQTKRTATTAVSLPNWPEFELD